MGRREHLRILTLLTRVVAPFRRGSLSGGTASKCVYSRPQANACLPTQKGYDPAMAEPQHLDSPEPGQSPLGCLSDEALRQAYERVAIDPDDVQAPYLLAEMRHRGLVCP